MRRRRAVLSMVVVVLLPVTACSDRLAAPDDDPSVPDPGVQLPELTVSEALAGSASGLGSAAASQGVAYVALPPGSLPGVRTVSIRNVSGNASAVTVSTVDGGFDPVAITAATGDQLELVLAHGTGAVSVAYATVPPRLRPVVVRTFPTRGRTDLAFFIAPIVIFNEPIDPGSLAAGVRLVRAGVEVEVSVELGAQPWQARVVPAAPLEPETDYELRITTAVRDLDGDSLATAVSIPFRTAAALHVWGDSRILFTDENRRLIVGDPDGTIAPLRLSGVCDVGEPVYPKLSPDGRKVVFWTDWMGPADVCVVSVDGSSERRLGIWGVVAWSADGNRILYVNQTGLNVINDDGSGAQLVVPFASLPPGGVEDLDVAPDGTIAFDNGGAIWLMDADGSRLRRIGEGAESLYEPDWSPDGARIAFVQGADRRTIASMAADGSDVRIHFRADAQLSGPEWSPDGRSIAFSSANVTYTVVNGITSASVSDAWIRVVDIESGVVRDLWPGGAWGISWAAVTPAVVPAWGNSRIAYGAQAGSNPAIFLGQPNGTIVQLGFSAGGYGPRLSPDGRRLLFLYDGMGPIAIRVIDLNGVEPERRFDWGVAAWSACGTSIVSVEGTALYTVNLNESRDSKRLLGSTLPSRIEHVDVSQQGLIVLGTLDGELWLTDADGSNLRRVRSGDSYQPNWSPDGSRIAFVAGADRAIMSMAADGADARIHFHPTGGARAHNPEWSPDGRALAFGLQASTGSSQGVHAVKLDDGSVSRLLDVETFGVSWVAVAPCFRP